MNNDAYDDLMIEIILKVLVRAYQHDEITQKECDAARNWIRELDEDIDFNPEDDESQVQGLRPTHTWVDEAMSWANPASNPLRDVQNFMTRSRDNYKGAQPFPITFHRDWLAAKPSIKPQIQAPALGKLVKEQIDNYALSDAEAVRDWVRSETLRLLNEENRETFEKEAARSHEIRRCLWVKNSKIANRWDCMTHGAHRLQSMGEPTSADDCIVRMEKKAEAVAEQAAFERGMINLSGANPWTFSMKGCYLEEQEEPYIGLVNLPDQQLPELHPEPRTLKDLGRKFDLLSWGPVFESIWPGGNGLEIVQTSPVVPDFKSETCDFLYNLGRGEWECIKHDSWINWDPDSKTICPNGRNPASRVECSECGADTLVTGGRLNVHFSDSMAKNPEHQCSGSGLNAKGMSPAELPTGHPHERMLKAIDGYLKDEKCDYGYVPHPNGVLAGGEYVCHVHSSGTSRHPREGAHRPCLVKENADAAEGTPETGV